LKKEKKFCKRWQVPSEKAAILARTILALEMRAEICSSLTERQLLLYWVGLKDSTNIVGRGGNFLLREVLFSLNVRIVGPLKQRVEAIMKRENMSRRTAELFVRKVDKEAPRWVHHAYGNNIDDPSAHLRKNDLRYEILKKLEKFAF
jgi:hypothetical protein